MGKPRGACKYCGGEKPAGAGRRACDPCLEKRKPIHERQSYLDRQARAQAERVVAGTHRKLAHLAPAGQKWCARCKQYLALDEFGSNGVKPSAYCKPCQSAYLHERTLITTYGIDAQEYARLLDLQGGRCAICECRPRTRRLAVDHDHKTGAVRGLLCTRCNHKLIGAAKESADILRRAAWYLENPPAATGVAVADTDADLVAMRIEADLLDAERVTGAPSPFVLVEDGDQEAVVMRPTDALRLLARAGYIQAEWMDEPNALDDLVAELKKRGTSVEQVLADLDHRTELEDAA